MENQLYFPPSLQRFEPRRMVFSTWVDHLPFAYDLIAVLRPKLTVELGVYNGLSFFTFCQALVEHDVDGVANGIDCWEEMFTRIATMTRSITMSPPTRGTNIGASPI